MIANMQMFLYSEENNYRINMNKHNIDDEVTHY